MNKKTLKIVKRICMILAILLVLLFAANWYLKYRLESYLRGVLSEKVAEATNGVYKLDFDHLSIGLISGELLIEGINLRPDSLHLSDTIYANKKLEEYVKVKIGSIYFKGVNLTWRTNYKKLKFGLFEVKNADIDIFNTSNAKTTSKETTIGNFDLYEIISPYINVLTVKKINLKNSSVSYRFTDEDGIVSRYALHDINFQANDFLLDENSESSGNLLYSDNFNFHVNTPQRLLSNGQFVLRTDQMIFDTKDSIIQIKNIQLSPKPKLWERVNRLPDSYLQGKIDSINVKGLFFVRAKSKNSLSASSFDINQPDIEYFEMKKDSVLKQTASDSISSDTLDLSWSLYSIISPLVNKVSINNIGVNDAKFKYSQCSLKDTNVYTLDRVNLVAFNFLVDSVNGVNTQKRFLYSDGFALKAEGIKGVDVDKNHTIEANRMMLNTIERILLVEDISFNPINTNTKDDYVIGRIAEIMIDDLNYNMGLEAKTLQITRPDLEYIKVSSVKEYENKENKTTQIDDGTNIWEQISPFFNHLLVKEITLKDGFLRYSDKVNGNIYSLYRLHFNATDLLIDKKTISTSNYLSAFKTLDFSFDRFEGMWKSNHHRIRTEKAIYSSIKENLRIENLQMIPLRASAKGKKSRGNAMTVLIPLIDFKGLKFKFLGFYLEDLKVKSLDIVSPKVSITELEDQKPSPKAVVSSNKLRDIIRRVDLNRLNISNAAVRYVSNSNKDTLESRLDKLELSNVLWSVGGDINLDRILLLNPTTNLIVRASDEARANYSSSSKQEKAAIYKGINITRFDIQNAKILAEDNLKKITVDIPSFTFSDLRWSKELLSLNAINMSYPAMQMLESATTRPDTIPGTSLSEGENIYKKLKKISNVIDVRLIGVSSAKVDYSFLLPDTLTKKHHMSEANISIDGLQINNVQEKYNIDNIDVKIKDFQYPSHYGFYSFQIDQISFDNQSNVLQLDSIALIPIYSKFEFAYKDPHHSDWFDVRSHSIKLSGIDFKKYISQNVLSADMLSVDYVMLQNLKNQKIEIEHNIMPMIYENLQNMPLKLSINKARIKDFNVIYEELPKKGEIPSRILFSNINGRLHGLTNIATSSDQFIDLFADGLFMNSGRFSVRWMLPVSKNYDCFELTANMQGFRLADLNQIVEPMAPVTINSGLVKDVSFKIEGSSIGADVDMLMLYNDLNLTIQKSLTNTNRNTLLTKVTNAIVKTNNPKNPNSKPRQPNLYVTRNPYHSTFNYLWQILQPPLVESVGVSQGKQNFIKKASHIFSSIKKVFKRRKKSIKKQIEGQVEHDIKQEVNKNMKEVEKDIKQDLKQNKKGIEQDIEKDVEKDVKQDPQNIKQDIEQYIKGIEQYLK